jgi:hypothetical protein
MQLHFISRRINCRGFNSSKSAYIKSALTSAVVLFLHEHWLSSNQLALLGGIDANFIHTGVLGFDNWDILIGRPDGGCAILWRPDLACQVDILPTNSKKKVRTIRRFDQRRVMPYEGDNDRTVDFADQRLIVEGLVNNNILISTATQSLAAIST